MGGICLDLSEGRDWVGLGWAVGEGVARDDTRISASVPSVA